MSESSTHPGTCDSRQFNEVFERSPDPWGYRSRWYEQRKRSIVLASLPRARYKSAFEPGCANGELTARLADRCDRVLACDFHPMAIALARQRLADYPNVLLEARRLPEAWPRDGSFDLIVLSEVGYYLSPLAMAQVARLSRRSLRGDGSLVSCHWRHPIGDALNTTPAVESALSECFGRPAEVMHCEADFSLLVWTQAYGSVARAEGLV